MAEIVNLNKARKAQGKAAKSAQAAQNRVAFGLTKGQTYPIDIFHAERHTDQSNYHIETTIDLSCITNVQVPYI